MSTALPAPAQASINFKGTDAILCLGDSITEGGVAAGGLIQRLTGYNTDWLLPIAEQVIATSKFEGASKIALVIIWMGANDSVLEGRPSGQHVPIDRYKNNLLAMYSLYPSSVATIFITPPPVDTKLWPDRNSDVTAQYGEVVKDLAKELGCGVVDSQKAFEGQSLTALLRDGLHLSAAGYEVIFRALIEVVAERYPELQRDSLPSPYPP